MNKICTSIEQSKKLIELGIDVNTADMWFHPYPNDEYWYDIPNIGNADLEYNQLPCWSPNALLDILKTKCERLEIILRVDNKWNIFATRSNFIYNNAYDCGCENIIDGCVDLIVKMNDYDDKIF